MKRTRTQMRTFYRLLDCLNALGIKTEFEVETRKFRLVTEFSDALHKLPFPTENLTFADVTQLLQGDSPSHQKMKRQFEVLTR